MALSPADQALLDRLNSYNGNAYNATSNPYGFARGGNQQGVFIAAVKDVAAAGALTTGAMIATSADVVLTHADVALTHQDASNTGLDRTATAQNVTLAAGQVALATQQADRSKTEADRAFGLAQSFNLPAITPAVANLFLKVNAAGTAWELSPLTIATVQQALDGTGTGLINAAVLGTAIDAAQNEIMPIGSYMLRSPELGAPSGNWMEALGQIVSRAAYPDLTASMPTYTRQMYDALVFRNPNQSGSTANSTFALQDNIGVLIQSTYAYKYDLATGQNIAGGTITSQQTILSTSELYYPPAMFNGPNSVIYFQQSGVPCHLDLTSTATMTATPQPPNNISVADGSYLGMYKMPNGNFVLFVHSATSPDRISAYRLPALGDRTQWAQFNPAGGQYWLTNYRTFQTKNGTVYLFARHTTGAFMSVYRTTDGVSWNICGSINDTSNGYDTDALSYDNRAALQKSASYLEESTDGQQIVMCVNAHTIIMSVNGGTNWTTLDYTNKLRNNITLPSGQNVGNLTQANEYGFVYESKNSRWIFAAIYRTTNNPNGNVLQLVVWSTTDLVTFTRLKHFEGTYNTPQALSDLSVLVLDTGVKIIGRVYPTAYEFTYTYSNNTVVMNGVQNCPAIYRIVNYPFKGHILLGKPNVLNGSEMISTRWIAADGSRDTGWVVPDTGPRGYPFIIISGNYMVGKQDANAQAQNNHMMGKIYDYNPETERKLPSVTTPLISNAYGIQEVYREGIKTGPKVYIRVK